MKIEAPLKPWKWKRWKFENRIPFGVHVKQFNFQVFNIPSLGNIHISNIKIEALQIESLKSEFR